MIDPSPLGIDGVVDPSLPSTEPPVDSAFAEIVEEITRRLQSGEPIDPEDYIRHNPECAGPIRRLLPTLETLISVARDAARDRPPRR
jgi:hypothetical protein